jgi:DNA-binding transcriptional LysR family regulator
MHFHSIALKYFRETVRAKSVRKAAERLNAAPSAVNRQILKLEEQVCCKLFDRSAAGMRLTAAGELFYHYVLKAHADLERTLSEIDDLRGVRRGHVTISCEEGVAKDALPEIVAAYREDHPRVTFSINVANMPTIVAAIAEGVADVGIAFNPVGDARVRRRAQVKVPVGAVMLPDHVFARRGSLNLADLVGEPLIVSDAGYSIRHLMNEQFDGEGERLLRHVVETNSFEAMTANIKIGLGIGIRSPVGIGGEIARGEVVFVPISDHSFRSQTVAVLNATRRPLPIAAAVFVERLAASLARLGQTNDRFDSTPCAIARSGVNMARALQETLQT